MHRLDAGRSRERLPPGCRFVEHTAEREDVGAGVHGLARDLLRRHVAGGADDAARLAAAGGEGRRSGEVAAAALSELGEAEVEDLGEAVGRDHEVAGLEVAVHDPCGVGLGEPLGGLREVAEQRPQVGSLLVDDLGERLAADHFHRDVVQRVRVGRAGRAHGLAPDLVDGDDVGMAQRRGRPGLELEASDAVFVADEVGREDLERDIPPQRPILGQIDLAHPAGAERRDDPVVGDLVLRAQRLPRLVCHPQPPRNEGQSTDFPLLRCISCRPAEPVCREFRAVFQGAPFGPDPRASCFRARLRQPLGDRRRSSKCAGPGAAGGADRPLRRIRSLPRGDGMAGASC